MTDAPSAGSTLSACRACRTGTTAPTRTPSGGRNRPSTQPIRARPPGIAATAANMRNAARCDRGTPNSASVNGRSGWYVQSGTRHVCTFARLKGVPQARVSQCPVIDCVYPKEPKRSRLWCAAATYCICTTGCASPAWRISSGRRCHSDPVGRFSTRCDHKNAITSARKRINALNERCAEPDEAELGP
jgi:hypothetical protein